MSEVLPSNLMITDVSVTNYHRAYTTESMSGIRSSSDSGIQWYKGTVTIKAYSYENVRLLNGFLVSLKGKLRNFELPLKGAYVNPNIGANPILSSSHSKGNSFININHSGAPIVMGSVFTVPNETKLYTLLETANGSGDYPIVPALKLSHAQAEVVNFMNPVITVSLDSNEVTINHESNGQIATATIAWTEALN